VLLVYDAILMLNQFLIFWRTALCLKYCELINQWRSVTSKQNWALIFSDVCEATSLIPHPSCSHRSWWLQERKVLINVCKISDSEHDDYILLGCDIPSYNFPIPSGLLLYSEGDGSTCIRYFGTYFTKSHGITSQKTIVFIMSM